MSEPGPVMPVLAADSDRLAARLAADAPALPPHAAQAIQAADDTEVAQTAQTAQSALTDLEVRERWLFRHVTRAGQVHPLRHLLRRYRAGQLA